MKWFLVCFIAVFLSLQAVATDLQITLPFFNASPASNRTVYIQNMTPFAGNLIYQTGVGTNQVMVFSNVAPGLVNGYIAAPPARIPFQVYLTGPSLGLIDASNCLGTGTAATYPAGQVAWAIATSDNRYALSGQASSNLFYPLNGNPNNYATNGPSVNPNQYIGSSSVTLTTNSGVVTITSSGSGGTAGGAVLLAGTATTVTSNNVGSLTNYTINVQTNTLDIAGTAQAFSVAGTNFSMIVSNQMAAGTNTVAANAVANLNTYSNTAASTFPTLTQLANGTNAVIGAIVASNTANLIITTNLITTYSNTALASFQAHNIKLDLFATNGVLSTNVNTPGASWVTLVDGASNLNLNFYQNGSKGNNTVLISPNGDLTVNSLVTPVSIVNTNAAYIGTAGSTNVEGTYYGVYAVGGTMTNLLQPIMTILHTTGTTFVIQSNGVSLYQTIFGPAFPTTWTAINGVNPVPTVSYVGALFNGNGTIWTGDFTSPGFISQINNASNNAIFYGAGLGTNIALLVGQGNTNFTLLTGLGNTNFTLATGLLLTNDVMAASNTANNNLVSASNVLASTIAGGNVSLTQVTNVIKSIGILNINGIGTNTTLYNVQINSMSNSMNASFQAITNVGSIDFEGNRNGIYLNQQSFGNFSSGIGVAVDTWLIGGTSNNITTGGGGQWQSGVILGGYENSFSVVSGVSYWDYIFGGLSNSITGVASGSTIVGGMFNVVNAGAFNNFLSGSNCVSSAGNTWMWNDGSAGAFQTAGGTGNQFLIHAKGGMAINTNNPSGYALNVAGSINATNLYINGTAIGSPASFNYIASTNGAAWSLNLVSNLFFGTNYLWESNTVAVIGVENTGFGADGTYTNFAANLWTNASTGFCIQTNGSSANWQSNNVTWETSSQAGGGPVSTTWNATGPGPSSSMATHIGLVQDNNGLFVKGSSANPGQALKFQQTLVTMTNYVAQQLTNGGVLVVTNINGNAATATLATNSLISVGESNGVYVAAFGASYSTFYGGAFASAIVAGGQASTLYLKGSWFYNQTVVGTAGTEYNFGPSSMFLIGMGNWSLVNFSLYTGQIILGGIADNDQDGTISGVAFYDQTGSVGYGVEINGGWPTHFGARVMNVCSDVGPSSHEFYIGGGDNDLEGDVAVGGNSGGNNDYGFVLKGAYNSIVKNATAINCLVPLWFRADGFTGAGGPGAQVTSNNIVDGMYLLQSNGQPRIECVSTNSWIVGNTITHLYDSQYRTNGEFQLIGITNSGILTMVIDSCKFKSPYVFDCSLFTSNMPVQITVINCQMLTNGVGLFNGTLYPTNQWTNLMQLIAVNLLIGGGTNENEVGTTPIITVP